MKLTILFLSLVLLWAAPAFAQPTKGVARTEVEPSAGAEPRTALVIGNARYESAPLRNPVNDARSMAGALRGLGFDVTLLEDASQTQMKRAIDRFGRKLRDGGVGLFYFSGHGMQVGGRNYLIPVNANVEAEEDVEYESVDAGRVLAKMESARNSMNLVILDACRNNPLARSFRNTAQGLATLNAPSGTFISYATAPGSVASDGSGQNGLYTGELVRHMKTAGLKLEEVFKRVRADVQDQSGDKQVPWDASSLTGDFYFIPPPQESKPLVTTTATPVQESTPTVAPSQFRADEEAWKDIKNSTDPGDFRFFLEAFPESPLAKTAEFKLKRLERKQKKMAQQPLTSSSQSALVQQPKKDSPTFSVNSEFFVKVFQFRGHTYALSNKVMNRYAAKQFAEKHEGYLVNLNDAKEDQFVVETFLSSRHKYLWIGINDIAHEGKWIWDGSSSNYTNWLPSQPGYPNTTENCAAYLYPDTQWHDVSCFPNKRVVVEWDAVAANAMVAEPPSSAQRQASLRVNANVRGSVYLDDEYKGFTGGTVTLKPGIYHLKVSRYNFQSYQEVIHLSAGEQKVANVFLKRAASKKAKLRVESNLIGHVHLDGQLTGLTGQTLEVKPGTYRVRVTREGSQPFLAIMTFIAGKTKTLHANFTKQAVPTRADIRQSYDQVLREGTPQALSGFIKRFQGQTQAKLYLYRAQKRLESLKQTQPTTTSSLSSSDSGLTKRQAYLDFLKAKGTNTAAALRRFIRKHSRTPGAKNYIQRARRQLRKLE